VSKTGSIHLVISTTGEIRCLYGEELPLATLGTLSIARASYVEPDRSGKWFADLSPAGGPRLGPYEQRSLAIKKEIAWLQSEWLLRDEQPRISDRMSRLGCFCTEASC
jgi:hypothetical protein